MTAVSRLERQRALLALVARQGDLSLAEACRLHDISAATARRDFTEIAARGLAAKTWGGLRRIDAASDAPGDMLPSGVRETLHPTEKARIAAAAAALVEDGDALMIDGGTTTLGLARHLANRPVRILTNSLLVAHQLDRLRTGRHGAEVYLTGGYLYPGSGLLVGPGAVASLAGYQARWAFLSVGGLDVAGATNTNQLVVEGERAMMRGAAHVVLLADHTKWGRRDLVRQCAWTEIHRLVTDAPPPYALAGGQVQIA
jgi:DeoR/GlpR family transcriptional regulator of sugar metabolism